MILVTGATGKIGSEVVKRLHARGQAVRALARSPEKARGLLPSGVEIAAGDLADPASIAAALDGADRLFLLGPVDARLAELETNAVRAAKAAGVRRIVKLSAIGADENAPVALTRWHKAVENELARSGIAHTVLQPTFFMQNVLGFAGTVRSQGTMYAPVHGKASYIDVRDIAEVAVAALTEEGHEGKTYVLTGAEALSYDEIAAKVGAAMGKPVRYVEVPRDAARAGMLEGGLPEWLADDLLALYDIINAGYAEATTDAVAAVTGREPIRFDQFARDHAEAFGGSPAAEPAAMG